MDLSLHAQMIVNGDRFRPASLRQRDRSQGGNHVPIRPKSGIMSLNPESADQVREELAGTSNRSFADTAATGQTASGASSPRRYSGFIDEDSIKESPPRSSRNSSSGHLRQTSMSEPRPLGEMIDEAGSPSLRHPKGRLEERISHESLGSNRTQSPTSIRYSQGVPYLQAVKEGTPAEENAIVPGGVPLGARPISPWQEPEEGATLRSVRSGLGVVTNGSSDGHEVAKSAIEGDDVMTKHASDEPATPASHTYEAVGKDESPRSPMRKAHKRVSSRSLNGMAAKQMKSEQEHTPSSLGREREMEQSPLRREQNEQEQQSPTQLHDRNQDGNQSHRSTSIARKPVPAAETRSISQGSDDMSLRQLQEKTQSHDGRHEETQQAGKDEQQQAQDMQRQLTNAATADAKRMSSYAPTKEADAMIERETQDEHSASAKTDGNDNAAEHQSRGSEGNMSADANDTLQSRPRPHQTESYAQLEAWTKQSGTKFGGGRSVVPAARDTVDTSDGTLAKRADDKGDGEAGEESHQAEDNTRRDDQPQPSAEADDAPTEKTNEPPATSSEAPTQTDTEQLSDEDHGKPGELVYEKLRSPSGTNLASIKPVPENYDLALSRRENKSEDKLDRKAPRTQRPRAATAVSTREERNVEFTSGRHAGAGWFTSAIRWAPLNVPLQRRLQTLLILAHTLSIAGGLALFFLLCTIPLLWPLLLPYLIYVLLSRASTSGALSHRSNYLRSSRIWSLFAGYFPARLHRSQVLEPTRKYIFGYHPHGIISHGAFAAFATEALGFSNLFPGITNTLLTLDSNFRIPLYRDYALRMGLASVSRESCENILSRGGPNGEGMGRAITIVVGGARESLDAKPYTLRLVLKRRKGFVKLAVRTGADLVPVLAFGENDLYDQLDAGGHPWVHRVQMIVKRIAGFTVPLFHARGVFNYDVGLMPYRRPINIVVGKPIRIQQSRNPDPKYVDQIHELYVQELERLWEDWKDTFARRRKGELSIVE
ncbi:hypothetical protein LTR62_003773 [Meristemomyces frigidus]|uniref:diacylglycerol O-acyltransferase n=1 Tax=Meristemomyces frigidus TaxID=1508187 RepID=A0AAN7YGI4_9PEZI|nr:hypothetical protein LTR62_003773 [Meristemomyces frigidus]